MTTDSPTTPWSTASSACWRQVEIAMELAKVATLLSDLQIGTVIPIHASSAPTLIITPVDPSDVDQVQDLTKSISKRLQEDTKWSTFAQGDNWLARLITKSGVRIDISTSITASKPTEFKV